MENPETGLRPTALGRMSPDYWADVALGLLMFSILIYSCTRTLVDPDLYWHLKCGMDICHTGVVVAKDTYSFLTGDQRWFNHEWLAEVFFAYIYFHWGWVAL